MIPNKPTPPAGHGHAPGVTHTPGPAGTGTDQVNPEDLTIPEVANNLRGSLPDKIIRVNGRPEAAPTDSPQPVEVMPKEQFVRAVADRWVDACINKTDNVPSTLSEVLDTVFLLEGFSREWVRVDLPFNAMQVRAGGYSALHADKTVAEASCLKLDASRLGRSLAQSERIRRIRNVLDPAYALVDANETVVLNDVATQVDAALLRGDSVIKANGALLVALTAARAIRGEPANTAVATRAQNVRQAGAVRADEQAKLAATSAAEPTAHATTTVTTQTPVGPTAVRVPPGGPAQKK